MRTDGRDEEGWIGYMMATVTTPLTAEEEATVRADHDGHGTCTYIETWPCLHARLLATLDAARESAPGLRLDSDIASITITGNTFSGYSRAP